MIRLIGNIFFAAFLFSGFYKLDLPLFFQFVDLTLLSGLLTALFIFLGVFKGELKIKKSLFLILLLLLLCSIPLMWTNWTEYAVYKVTRMFTITLLAMVAPFFLIRDNKDLYIFLQVLMFIGLIICGNVFFKLIFSNDIIMRLTNESASTNGMALMAALVCIYYFIISMEEKKILHISFFILSFFILISSGSRAELVGFIFAASIIFIARYLNRSNLFNGIFFSCLVLFFILFFKYLPESSTTRILDLFSSSNDLNTISEAAMRPQLWADAYKNIPFHPFGVGWGGYERFSTSQTIHVLNAEISNSFVRSFPHNVFLETFLEGGWLAGIFLSFLTAKSLFFLLKSLKEKHNYLFPILFGILTILFFETMISGEWNDSRLFFSFLAIVLIFSSDKKNNNYSIGLKKK